MYNSCGLMSWKSLMNLTKNICFQRMYKTSYQLIWDYEWISMYIELIHVEKWCVQWTNTNSMPLIKGASLPWQDLNLTYTSVACAVCSKVNPLQNRKLNMWTLFCNVCIDFLKSQTWKEIMLELNGKSWSVNTFSTDVSFQNLVFKNLFEFSVAEIAFKSISPTF